MTTKQEASTDITIKSVDDDVGEVIVGFRSTFVVGGGGAVVVGNFAVVTMGFVFVFHRKDLNLRSKQCFSIPHLM